MSLKEKRVEFAEEKSETDFRRLASSQHPEDRRLYSVLSTIKKELGKKWSRGIKITGEPATSAYRQMYGVPGMRRLKLEKFGTVIFSLSRARIRIWDIL